MSTVADRKVALRQQLRQQLNGLPPATRAAESRRLCQNLTAQLFWKNARTILAFLPTKTEPDISDLIAQGIAEGRTICLPRFDGVSATYLPARVQDIREVQLGPHGILEPSAACPGVDLQRLDLILVPGVGFSPSGGRLGRGQGHYDRLLAATPGCKCGVAFDQQLIPDIPLEAHDVRLDWLVTPSRCVAVTGPGGV